MPMKRIVNVAPIMTTGTDNANSRIFQKMGKMKFVGWLVFCAILTHNAPTLPKLISYLAAMVMNDSFVTPACWAIAMICATRP
ncbi:MAG: hypothetical protein FD173_1489 [Gallionellaceae bacterium]|nr:MAG: hypothetical protein FD173_1489 [Gallionellaceae bacterium]